MLKVERHWARSGRWHSWIEVVGLIALISRRINILVLDFRLTARGLLSRQMVNRRLSGRTSLLVLLLFSDLLLMEIVFDLSGRRTESELLSHRTEMDQ